MFGKFLQRIELIFFRLLRALIPGNTKETDNVVNGIYSPHQTSIMELEPHQNALLRELNSKDTLLGDIYLGSLRVMADGANPDRYHLAGHGFRELLNRLPDQLGISSKELKISMGSKIFSLRDSWEKFISQLNHSDSMNMWGTNINPSLRRFLNAAEDFFSWLDEHRPKRRQVIEQTINEFEYSLLGLPDPIKSLRIDEWMKYHDYFVEAAHHRPLDPEIFKSYQYNFEIYLLDRFRPRTFEDISEIDELIKEGELRD
jgi:hypothetical protein